jgi:hypothetical protein
MIGNGEGEANRVCVSGLAAGVGQLELQHSAQSLRLHRDAPEWRQSELRLPA